MTSTRHTWLAALICCWALSGCLLEPFSGSEVVLELGTASLAASDIASDDNEHYALYAVMVETESLVLIDRFYIDDQLDARSYPDGALLGVANRPSGGLPEGGINLKSEADLADAVGVLLSIERNGETDPAPDAVVARGELEELNRSVLSGDLEGGVPRLDGGTAALVNSRVAIIIQEP